MAKTTMNKVLDAVECTATLSIFRMLRKTSDAVGISNPEPAVEVLTLMLDDGKGWIIRGGLAECLVKMSGNGALYYTPRHHPEWYTAKYSGRWEREKLAGKRINKKTKTRTINEKEDDGPTLEANGILEGRREYRLASPHSGLKMVFEPYENHDGRDTMKVTLKTCSGQAVDASHLTPRLVKEMKKRGLDFPKKRSGAGKQKEKEDIKEEKPRTSDAGSVRDGDVESFDDRKQKRRRGNFLSVFRWKSG